MRIVDTDRVRIAAAVTAAENTTDAELMVIAARESDAYHDVSLHWALLTMLLAIAVLASAPDFYTGLVDRISGRWHLAWSARELLTMALIVATLKFLAVRLILTWRPLRLALTPRATKARRVRRRAITLFKTGIENRTASRTGALLYLSLAEHRAEIVVDETIHRLVPPERWGSTMADLIDAVRADKTADGIVAAISAIGLVLAEACPRTDRDPNELPDRMIEL